MPALNDSVNEPEIRAALDKLVLGWPDVTVGTMFGSRAYRAKGVLFAMIGGDGLILTKLEQEQRDAAAEEHAARPFIGRGKEIPSWTEFPLEDDSGVVALAAVVRVAYENALTEAASAGKR